MPLTVPPTSLLLLAAAASFTVHLYSYSQTIKKNSSGRLCTKTKGGVHCHGAAEETKNADLA